MYYFLNVLSLKISLSLIHFAPPERKHPSIGRSEEVSRVGQRASWWPIDVRIIRFFCLADSVSSLVSGRTISLPVGQDKYTNIYGQDDLYTSITVLFILPSFTIVGPHLSLRYIHIYSSQSLIYCSMTCGQHTTLLDSFTSQSIFSPSCWVRKSIFSFIVLYDSFAFYYCCNNTSWCQRWLTRS